MIRNPFRKRNVKPMTVKDHLVAVYALGVGLALAGTVLALGITELVDLYGPDSPPPSLATCILLTAAGMGFCAWVYWQSAKQLHRASAVLALIDPGEEATPLGS